jgi:hypothetical protein
MVFHWNVHGIEHGIRNIGGTWDEQVCTASHEKDYLLIIDALCLDDGFQMGLSHQMAGDDKP